ncbi:SCPU domain-containing protein [Xanthomonas hortorum pv. vitians]|nr:SCPU domain-containing protein [Xanthomonas hortorum pv. vitians]QEW15994.1 SCPU domain-containing protein [Xanthomonas hortorum]NMI24723.1 SCPU domain-containing protein [Xanthomonas hortorum pv. vitians]NMI30672.1 SCPU domain-containing protein [Xanthomonas hortorum pv. vitians]NMI33626.1 SCPU domain-containing protein [Xanthomonas hortorum pv. vitians]
MHWRKGRHVVASPMTRPVKEMSMRTVRPVLLSLGLLSTIGVATAADTTTFNVKIAVTKACTITAASATDVDFGSVLSTSTANADANGSVTAQCTALTPYNIALSAGSNAGTANDVTTRRMKNTDALVTTNNFIAYQLYQDLGRSTVWGSTSGTNTLSRTATGINQVYPVYGRVTNPSANNPATGAYQDTITATIVY